MTRAIPTPTPANPLPTFILAIIGSLIAGAGAASILNPVGVVVMPPILCPFALVAIAIQYRGKGDDGTVATILVLTTAMVFVPLGAIGALIAG